MKKTKIIISALICLILCLSAIISPTTAKASADNVSLHLDSTNVLDDLNASLIDGEPFNINDYPYKEKEKFSLLSFVEYCYSFKANLQINYGLYFYIYNPSKKAINTLSTANKVQLATQYDLEEKAVDWATFELQFCSKSSGEYENLFYKFRLKNTSSILSRINLDPYKRRYDIAGIELVTNNSLMAEDVGVGYKYVFTGFALGLGNNNTTSTLEYFPTKFKTVETKITSVNFRPEVVSEDGKNYQNNLTSVYFPIDTALLEEYGNIQRIKAIWDEYRTSWVMLTNKQYLYNNLKPYIGYNTKGKAISSDTYGLKFGTNDYNTVAFFGAYNNIDMLTYWDYVNESELKNVKYSSQQLIDYILNYDKSYEKGYITIGDKQVSADLFSSIVDEGRTRGANEHIFNINEPNDWLDLKSYSSNHNGWDKFWDFFFSASKYDLTTEYPNISPIIELSADDFIGTDEQISKRLYIDEKDLYREDGTSLKDYNTLVNAQGKTLILLRVANTNYYSEKFSSHSKFLGNDVIDSFSAGYASYQTVFLNFDVIWLDFVKEGVSTIIPSVANPINILSDVTPPLKGKKTDWLTLITLILLVLLLIILLIFFATPIMALINLTVSIIILPFKIVKSLFKQKPK